MNRKNLRIPALIFAVGLVLTLVACLVTNIILVPAVTEGEFHYSVTYQLNGETKKLEGVYHCRYEGFADGGNPRDRYYEETYTVDGETSHSGAVMIAQHDSVKLYMITRLDASYLMGDTRDEDYEPYLEEPELETEDDEGYAHDPSEQTVEFDAQIISWEYPEPLENHYVFKGFSMLYDGSMIAMAVVGLLVVLACAIFVKRDPAVSYKLLDRLSILANFVICLLGIPFMTITGAMLQITMDTDHILYQIYMCYPVLTAFLIAAAIVLRRKGFTKAGFILPFVGPVLFFLPVALEPLFMVYPLF